MNQEVLYIHIQNRQESVRERERSYQYYVYPLIKHFTTFYNNMNNKLITSLFTKQIKNITNGVQASRTFTSAATRVTTPREDITEVSQHASASTAWEKSCYNKIDYTIEDDLSVYEAVQRFSAYNVGALVTTKGSGEISGVISERDYINKIALLGKTSKETKISEIATSSHNLIVATKEDTINDCMEKMLSKDIRHLPLVDEQGKAIGLLSIKDLIKEVVNEKNETISRLSQFALGKGGHFVVD